MKKIKKKESNAKIEKIWKKKVKKTNALHIYGIIEYGEEGESRTQIGTEINYSYSYID